MTLIFERILLGRYGPPYTTHHKSNDFCSSTLMNLAVHNPRMLIFSWNFSHWFTVGEGDKLLDSTFFTNAYRPDNIKCTAVIWSDNLLFRNVNQPQANREKYVRDFRISQKWRQHEMHNLEYKVFYYRPPSPFK